jgi:hypothetical protein
MLEDKESLEVFIAPSSREACHVPPVDVFEALPDEHSWAYMLYRARKKRTSMKGAFGSAAASGSDTGTRAENDTFYILTRFSMCTMGRQC